MPTALSIDKDFVKSLYVNGVPAARIAEQTGVRLDTICQWVRRGKWKAELPAERPDEQVALKNVAEEINNKALALSKKILCKLDDLKLVDLADCKSASSALAASYATARKASGQDDDNERGLRGVVNIFQTVQLPGSVTLPSAPSDLLSDAHTGQVIDVSPVSEQAPGPESTPESTGPSANA